MKVATKRAARARWVLMACALMAMGCSSDSSTTIIDPPATENPGGTVGTGTGAVATVAITPSTGTVDIGATTTFAAVALNAQGQTLSGFTVAWSVSNAARASITSAGVVRGLSEGDVTVTATIDGKTASASLMVEGPPEVEG